VSEPTVDITRARRNAGPFDAARAQQAAALLRAVRLGAPRLAALPPGLAPVTLADAYAIQDELLALLASPVGGWKATLFDARHGICAPIPANALLPSPAVLALATAPTRGTLSLGVECEVAFLMGRDLPPLAGGAHHEIDAVLAAVASVHPVIELVTSRYASQDAVSQLERVADAFMNEALVVGPALADWRTLALAALPLTMRINGEARHAGTGGHPLGDPIKPLVWLANHLAQLGRGLRAGEIVTTGSCAGVHALVPAQQAVAEFAGLGCVSIRLS
jgi:2-keto-4-pentenoate hydratase